MIDNREVKRNLSGTRGHSGRKRKPAAKRGGEVWVRLSLLDRVYVTAANGHLVMLEHCSDGEYVVRWFDSDALYHDKHTRDYAAAAAEFVRRVNEVQ